VGLLGTSSLHQVQAGHVSDASGHDAAVGSGDGTIAASGCDREMGRSAEVRLGTDVY